MKRDEIANLFEGMRPLDVTEYIILAAMVAVLPFGWSLAVKALFLLVVNTIVKAIVTRKVGNPALRGLPRWSVWLMLAFYLYCLFTLCFSTNMEYGLRMLGHRLPLLLFPLCCLVSDMSWLDMRRRRVLMWLLPLSLSLRLVVRCIAVFLVGHSFVFGTSIDPIHHTYLAMYQLLALGFIYSELVTGWKQLSRRQAAAVAVVTAMVVAHLVLVFSRTGILGLVLMTIAIVFHQLFLLKNVRVGLGVALVAAVFVVGFVTLMPEEGRRFGKTVNEVSDGDMSDIRIWQYREGVKGVVQHLPFGVGVGDGLDALHEAYRNSTDTRLQHCGLNAHNIFIDAAMSMGLPGLLLLVAMFVVPSVHAVRRRDITLMAFLFAFLLTGMFEAILNRQMGLMFVGMYWLVLLGGEACHDA